jgi:hypothetical protein
VERQPFAVAPNQHRTYTAVLCHVHYLLLGCATKHRSSIFCWCKADHHIERLYADREIRLRYGKLIGCNARQALNDPLTGLVKGLLDSILPFCLADAWSNDDSVSSVTTVRLQHQHIAILVGKIQ